MEQSLRFTTRFHFATTKWVRLLARQTAARLLPPLEILRGGEVAPVVVRVPEGIGASLRLPAGLVGDGDGRRASPEDVHGRAVAPAHVQDVREPGHQWWWCPCTRPY